MSEPIQSIAQNNYILHNIDAKKLYVQEPLFTANSGDAVYVGWRPDETVLWEGSYSGTSAIPFTESYKNFEYARIDFKRSDNLAFSHTFNTSDQTFTEITLMGQYCRGTTAGGISLLCSQYTLSNTSLQWVRGAEINIGYNSSNASANKIIVTKVIGVNRKENA